MKKTRSSAKALFRSGLALLLCVSMFIGSTMAWFTDRVVSHGNIIQSGDLQIDMQWAAEYKGEETVWNDAAGEDAKPVFDYQNWEPGYTEVRYIKVTNEGNLAFKWMMSVIPVGMVGKLAEVIDVRVDVVSDNPHFTAPTAEDKAGSLRSVGTLSDAIAGDKTVVEGVLLPEGKEAADFYSGEIIACVALQMRMDAGNEYQGENVGDSFNILLKATQYAYEYDSFGSDYDLDSTYPHITTDLQLNASIKGLVDENNRLTKEIVLTDPPTGISATIPVGTLVDVDASQLVLRITEDGVDNNITLDNRVGYDVEVIGVAFNNDKPIVVFMPKVLPAQQTGTQLSHAGKAMTRVYSVAALSQREGNNDTYGDKYIYDFNSGNVYFSLIHFSNVSLASTDTVTVKGKPVTGISINMNQPGEWLQNGVITIPADGNTYILTYNSGDQSKKNALDLTLTHTWHNLNPGELSSTPIKVEKGATVVLNGVNIRTNSGVDALEIINPANVTENKVGVTYIYVADGTQNWLTGKSGIGFGANSPNYVADIYVEGYGSLYTTAMGWGSPGIGVDSYSDGNQSKMHFSVGFLRSIPMNAAAGIGGGFAGQSWFCLNLIEFNGGTYHLYRGGDSASIGTGTNGDLGEIIINAGSTVHCYTNPWTAYGRNMGRGMYAGNCAGIYVSEDADVYGWSYKNGSYGDWNPCDNYVPSGRSNDANVVVNGFKTIDSIEATVRKGVYTVMAKFGEVEVQLPEGQYKVDGDKVSSNAIYGYDTVSKNYVTLVISTKNVPTVETTAVDRGVESLNIEMTTDMVLYTDRAKVADKLGVKVTATFGDGTTEDVTDEAAINYGDTATCGEKTITVSYEGKETTEKYIIGSVFADSIEDIYSAVNNLRNYGVADYAYKDKYSGDNYKYVVITAAGSGVAQDKSAVYTNNNDGTLLFSNNGTTNLDGSTFHGWGKVEIKSSRNANANCMVSVMANDLTFRNLTFTAVNTSSNKCECGCQNYLYYGFKIEQNSNGSLYSGTVLDGVTINNGFTKSALMIQGCDNITITNCNINNKYGSGSDAYTVIGISNTGAKGDKGVTITNTHITAIRQRDAHIQFNYPTNGEDTSMYKNPSKLYFDDTVTFYNDADGNTSGVIFSESGIGNIGKDIVYYGDVELSADVDRTHNVAGTGWSVTLHTGNQEGKITYSQKAVTDDTRTLSSITVTKPTKTEYFVGDSLDLSGLEVTANFANGTPTSADVTSKAVVDSSAFKSAVAGTYAIKVSYTFAGTTKTETFNVTVKERPAMTGIKVTKLPTNISYNVGQAFDWSGIEVSAVYSDGSNFPLADGTWTKGPVDTSKEDSALKVYVSYESYSTYFTIKVTSIAVPTATMTMTPTSTKDDKRCIGAGSDGKNFYNDIPIFDGLVITDYNSNGTSVSLVNNGLKLPSGWQASAVTRLDDNGIYGATGIYEVTLETNHKDKNGKNTKLVVQVAYFPTKGTTSVGNQDIYLTAGGSKVTAYCITNSTQVNANTSNYNGPHYRFTYTGYNGESVTTGWKYCTHDTSITKRGGGCVTGDTLVMLADGTEKRIDQVTYDDQLLVWNFFEGKYDVAPSAIIFNHGMDNYNVLSLNFEDGTTVKTINDHGFYDVEENEFVFITEENVAQYVGDHFVKVDGDSYTTVKLVDFSITEEYVGSYSIYSAVHVNFMTEGMFSLTNPPIEGFFECFEYGDGMKYDEAKMQADIEEYGLYEYEVFAPYGVTYEQYVAFNMPYLKFLVGRGDFTFEDILMLLSEYVVN